MMKLDSNGPPGYAAQHLSDTAVSYTTVRPEEDSQVVEDEGDLLASVFEERAEYLSRSELTQWTTVTDRDRTILSKLTGPGAKLLIGPRGSGKSTLLRQAYYDTQ